MFSLRRLCRTASQCNRGNYLPDPRGASLHLGLKFSYVRLYVCLLRSKLTPTHSSSLRSPKFQLDTQPLRTKKFMQPRKDKDHATSRDTKKSCNLSGQKKNHATSRDKQKSCNLSGQKKIMQPLRTKKITQPLELKKSCNLSGRKKKSCHLSVQKKSRSQ